MGAITGKAGAVDGAAIVRNWNISETADTQAYVASNTHGGTGRLPGNVDWSGAYDAYGHTPANMPGAGFTFTGSIDGTEGVVGLAIVDQVVITCDIEGGGILSNVTNFSANGVLDPTGAVASDTPDVIPPSAIGCKVELDEAYTTGTPVWVEVTDVRTWTLTLTSANPSYVSSSTAGQTKRNIGNLDATMSYTVYDDDIDHLIPVNTIAGMKLYVNSTLYWEILWTIFGEMSDIQVDIETSAFIGATQNASMNGLAVVSASDTIGSIKTPAASPVTIWPAA